jgi:uncharacterized repeat protein (TIGR04052 family)
MKKNYACLAGLFLVGVAACGSEDANGQDTTQSNLDSGLPQGHARYTLQFNPLVNGDDFSCRESYDGIGLGNATIGVLDFRLWLHDITLVRKDGQTVRLTLDESRPTLTVADRGAWQKDGVALLDFEDAKGSCTGTPEVNTTIVGTAPQREDYVGVSFKVGVPDEHNHVDATVALYPFGAPGMSWQWKSGYRFVRLDVQTEAFPKYYFHLGSTACDGEIGNFECDVANIAEIELSGFTGNNFDIEVDLASIYDELDVDASPSNSCMSGGTDNPLCPSMFGAFGLTYGQSPKTTQRFFRVAGGK